MDTPCKPVRELFEARLAAAPSELLLAFYEAPHLEREKRQFDQFLQVDQAHAVMLAEQGILAHAEAKAILAALADIAEKGVARFPWDARRGSLLLHIEHALFERVGERIGGKLHIGRSRLDQGPTARRLYKRKHLLGVFSALIDAQRVILRVASEYQHTVMPGYTCMQHAHPTTFGHWLLAFGTRLAHDFDRLAAAWIRLNLSPLGAAGLSGTSWPIDRERTAQLLGFDGLVENARTARDAWYAAEIIAGLSFVMATLNSLATDLHLWSSAEFAYVAMDDAFCATSSIFPQKKNPTGLEAIKFAAGQSTTWLAQALATFRAEGTGDVVMYEVPLLDDAFPATTGSLRLCAAMLESLTVFPPRMLEQANAHWSTATDLADQLVRTQGWSFREAHGVVARLVRNSLAQGVAPAQVTAQHLCNAATDMQMETETGLARPALATRDIRQCLDTAHFVKTRTSAGGASPGQLSRLCGAAARGVDGQAAWLDGVVRRLAESESELARAVRAFTDA